jgi:hypothetical protein
LLAPFQKYLEISVVFGLIICTATANTSYGNKNVVLGFFFRGRVVEYSEKKVGLRVIAEKMKGCSYLRV